MSIERGPAECWLTNMDGILVHEAHALPGAADFLQRLVDRERRFLVLTNGSTRAGDVARFPFRPSRVVDSIADVIDLI